MIEILLWAILVLLLVILFFVITILLYLSKFVNKPKYPSTVRARQERHR